MTAHGAATTRGDAATARRVAAPTVLLQRTKTRGWRVMYVSSQGVRVVRGRGMEEVDARVLADRVADLHGCRIEVELI